VGKEKKDHGSGLLLVLLVLLLLLLLLSLEENKPAILRELKLK